MSRRSYDGAQRVGAGSGHPGRDARRVGIVAIGAVELARLAEFGIPVAVDPAVGSGFPIAVVRAVAAAAQLGAVGKLQLAAIADLEGLEVGLVVAVVTP